MFESEKRIKNLGESIRKAIEDGKITDAEYQQIIRAAEADHVIDANERQLLRQLHAMIVDGTIERVRD